jgi:glycosyltransferase involved in cell wall biosynthesis
LFSRFDSKRIYWHKYAGNWGAGNLSFTYNLQRSLLKRLNSQNIRITVNGNWNETNRQIIPFENPCISEAERIQAGNISDKKDFTGALKLLFVGGLNIQKGVNELIAAIESGQLPSSIVDVYIIGTGGLFDTVSRRAREIKDVRVHLPGNLNRKELNEYYTASHILILPSTSEGFPKVIAEAAAYGCIPVVTDVSSISQYINGNNGFIMPDNKSDTIIKTLQNLPAAIALKRISRNVTEFTKLFTYEYYISRMKDEIWIRNK